MNMKSKIVILYCLVIGVIIVIGINMYLGPILIRRSNMAFDDNTFLLAKVSDSFKRHRPSTSPPLVSTVFTENFDTPYTVTEAGSMSGSNSPNWWLSSGAYFYSTKGIGNTIAGSLSAIDTWRVAYFISNPLDTDNGYYPQNIFRLVLRSKWQNFQQETYFRIAKDNVSDSSNRNASNGLLLFNRYQDGNNLYYTGVRVDGHAIIKKKIGGKYYTMAEKTFYSGVYSRETNPNLIPVSTWTGLRSEVKTNTDGTVNIKVFIDKDKTGNWILAIEAKDDGESYGGAPILTEGYAGIRTDFMDVEFDDYSIHEL